MKRGLFITFEGPDGAGKTTQIQRLRDYMQRNGREVLVTREPGGTAISEKIREVILDKDNSEMSSVTEMLLYAAARAQLVAQVIKPSLENGITVICDRFVDSSIAYQGYGRNLGDSVHSVNQYAVDGCLPDLTFLIRLDPQIGISRIKVDSMDRLESEKAEFHKRVADGYEYILSENPGRVVAIDGSMSIENISIEITRHIDGLL